MALFDIKKLNYLDIKDVSLSFNKGKIYFVVGSNNSGKSILYKIMNASILINNVICLDGIMLNKDTKNNYLKNIGIVERVNENSFYFKKVIDEMYYSLSGFGYNKIKALEIIQYFFDKFKISSFLSKNINELDIYERQKILIIKSLIKKPKVLLMDNCLDILKYDDVVEILNILKELCNDYLTVIYFTSNLNYIDYAYKIELFSKYKYIGEFNIEDIYNKDKLFYENNIEIPFIMDLSIKLKMYNLINKNYDNLSSMVDDIWD